jgi:iron complex transport system ATP-binding protein
MSERSLALHIVVDALRLGGQQVLTGVELRCETGSHTAILGPNGAGKTTLLRALVGLVRFQGRVMLSGAELGSLSAAERAQRIAYVPQRSLLQSALSVRDVVGQGRYAHQSRFGRLSASDRRVVDAALEMTDVANVADRPYPDLSGGEQRRVMLARALATEAEVIALDEPTAALDVSHQLDFFATLSDLKGASRTIVTVLHDLRDAARFCDHALVLDRGKPVHYGSAELPPDLVRDVYGVRMVAQAEARFERVTTQADRR